MNFRWIKRILFVYKVNKMLKEFKARLILIEKGEGTSGADLFMLHLGKSRFCHFNINQYTKHMALHIQNNAANQFVKEKSIQEGPL